MNKKCCPNHSWIIFILVLLIHIPGSSQELPLAQGELVGHIYEKDGITPVSHAIVKIKRLPNGEVYTSSLSDQEGMFRVRSIEKGVYLLGVKTSLGNFNGQRLLGILIPEDGAAKMDIELSSDNSVADNVIPLSLMSNPVGQVSIVAGNQAIFDGIAVIDDEPTEAGPFRIRSPE